MAGEYESAGPQVLSPRGFDPALAEPRLYPRRCLTIPAFNKKMIEAFSHRHATAK